MARTINFLVVHSAATPNGRAHTVYDIDSWHRDRKFNRKPGNVAKFNPDLRHIGYHYVIYVDGTVRTGRAEWEIGAHVAGFNANSIGICMIGNDKFTKKQWSSLQMLLLDLQRKYPAAQCLGHRDFSPDKNRDGVISKEEWIKYCPGFSVRDYVGRRYQPADDRVLA